MDRLKIYKHVIIYGLFLVIMFATIYCKKNFHVDEISSYILSNNIESIYMTFETEQTYTPTEKVYLDNMTVNDTSKRFNFANVWENQANDVHPPFYYLFLHTICSFHVGKFSIWYAGIINICFALLSLYVLRKLIHLFSNDNVIVDFASILFALSTGVLQNVSFLRMYVMAMFWVTLTAYLFVSAFDKAFSWKLWAQIGLTAIAGALTHYYCIIYLCATCLVFGICLIMQKRWKDIASLISCMVLSASISIAIFPAMLTHMFSGYRGTQSVDNMVHGTMSEHWERIKSFYGIINTQMLGRIGGGGTVFTLLIIVLFFILSKKYGKISIVLDKVRLMRWMIIGIPLIIYFSFVSISAVYITDRYMFPIYAVTLGLFLCVINAVWRKVVSEKYVYIVMCLVGTAFIINGFGSAKWDYLYKSSSDLLNNAQLHSDRNCIGVYDEKWREQSAFLEMKNYKSVTFIAQEQYDNILQYGELFQDGFMLNIIGGDDDKIINMIQTSYPYLSNCEKIGGFAYSTTYYISAEKRNVYIYNYERNGVIGADGFDLCSNVLLTPNRQDVWLIMKDADHAVIQMNRMVLDIEYAQYENGTNIQVYDANDSDAQRWKLIRNEDGSFSLLAKDERFALTCGSDGNIYLAEYHEDKNSQKWWIE